MPITAVRRDSARHFLPLLLLLSSALLAAGCASPQGGGAAAADAWKPERPNLAPPYPAESRIAGEQGQVMLQVQTGADGRPTRVEVKQSSGYMRLDEAAVKAVRQWQFKPLPQDGTVTWREVPINFMQSGASTLAPR